MNIDNNIYRKQDFWDRFHLDPYMLLLICAIFTVGVVVLYSASDKNMYMLVKQSVTFVVGMMAMIAIAQLNPFIISRFTIFLYVIGLILLIVVFVYGHTSMGATRWINIGFMKFQPSEIMKICVPGAVATFISKDILPPSALNISTSIIIILIPAFLILQQPDLGTAIIVCSSGIFVLFLAGLQIWWILGGILLFTISGFIAYKFDILHSYQIRRIETLFNPESDPLGAGWNITQSKIAIGSGGLFGKGWLNGTQSHLNFLPESHTDFIVAVLAEEFGFIGVMLLMCIYGLIIARFTFIAFHAQTGFDKLMAGSITLTFFIYIFVNIGMVSGILPVVGVPLPMISNGGTHLLTLLLMFGIMMSISTHKRWRSFYNGHS